MATQTFEDLEVWKRSCRQAVPVCRAMAECRDFPLKDQRQRAGISVPSNIAEGHERDSKKDFIRFLRIAKGSNGELRTQLYIAAELSYLPRETAPRDHENHGHRIQRNCSQYYRDSSKPSNVRTPPPLRQPN